MARSDDGGVNLLVCRCRVGIGLRSWRTCDGHCEDDRGEDQEASGQVEGVARAAHEGVTCHVGEPLAGVTEAGRDAECGAECRSGTPRQSLAGSWRGSLAWGS